ncbi:MAG: hypothetical protein WBN85_09570 [Candidatus Macondimonas sp.]
MKKSSLLLSLGSLLTLPLPAMAAMTEMADSELADVSGQAYVVDFGRYEHAIPDLTERDIVLVSDTARYIEADYPLLTGLARQGTVTATNAAIVSGKTAAIASVATVPGVSTVVAPILSLLPTPKISFG